MRHVLRAGCGLAALALALFPAPARAHLVIFKDGFVLEGQVKRESKTYFDEFSKEAVLIPKGFFMIDDGARRIFFSPSQARVVERKSAPAEEVVWGRSPPIYVNPRNLPPLLEVLEATPWNDKLERNYTFRSPDGPVKLKQQVRVMMPSHLYVDAPGRYFWSSAYMTREFSPETVLALLAVAPDVRPVRAKEPKGAPAPAPAVQRFKIADFLGQGGWYDLAEKELDRIAQEAPDQKSRALAAKGALARLRARDLYEDIKRLHLAGRPAEVRRRMAEFPEKDAA
jgi:hypothetical protein